MKTFASIFSVMFFISLLVGCKVSMEKVEKWKKNSDTARLKKCLADKEQSEEVRVAAGLALFELGRYYGVEVKLREVKERSEEEARKLAGLMQKKLSADLKGTGEKAVQAKDGLFSLWEFVPQKQQSELEEKIVTWLLENWISVSNSGEHSAKKIFEKWGERAGKVLTDKLTLQHDNLYDVSTLVADIATKEDKEKLVKKFAAKLDKNPALMSRADRLHSIGKLCSKTSLSFLQRLALKGFNFAIRRNAMIGLRLCPDVSSVDAMIKTLQELQEKTLKDEVVNLPKFKDKKPGLIHQAFEVLDAVKNWKATKPGLTKILSLTSDKKLSEKNKRRKLLIRTKVGQYLVFIGGIEGLQVLLQNLPDDEYPGGYILALRDAVKQVFSKKKRQEALEVLRKAIKEANWVGKITALETLAVMGEKEKDGETLKALSSDETELKGWGAKGVTMGERAAIGFKRLNK